EKHDDAARRTLDEVNRLLPEGARQAVLYKADIRKESEVRAMFDFAEERFGHVEILINNAGIASNKLLQEITEEEWIDIFDVNVHGAYRCIRRAVPNMVSAKAGKIIGISSIWGVTGGAMEVHYSATKGAIIAMNKALAKELGYSGITVNTVAPGGVATDMLADLTQEQIDAYCSEFPLGRLARAEEIAKAVMFLLSDGAAYITGEVLNVNGGAHI
ncbi:MAG: SDR family oxidoreductase, partial [Bacillota bacterium]|nr:SDR family oxidoreductase [Bacillota bacterium]